APETQPTAVPEAKPTKEPVTPPETGDQAQLGLYLALAAAAAGSLTLAGVFNQQRRGKR
ncbi:sortase B protein-sorting domain-containing protein, partial [Pseudoflavonifractor capillosus]|nr:sortase B protein-sorting domain-containing protein [Pseudoflavonifractor capillosus]